MTQLDSRPEPGPIVPEPTAVPARTRWQRVGPLSIGALVVAGLTLALHFRDPHQQGSWGICPSVLIFGIYCPGCGGMRAVNDLTNGDLRAAASSNLLALTIFPLVVLWWLTRMRDQWRGVAVVPLARQHTTTITYAITGVAVVFAIVRNTPWGAALAP